MGAQIITAIKDGLGLLGDLASEFLDAFNTMIVQVGAEGATTLTTFGQFAFIMLGIAVAFSVVKLVYRIVTNNTGI